MGLYRRADSRFWWMALERPGHQPIRESTKIPLDGGTQEETRANKRTAQHVYAARMRLLAESRYRLPTDKPTIKFADFRTWYLEQFTKHKRGVERERSILKQLGYHFDAWRLHQITRDLILEWRTARSQAVKPRTVNRELGLLKHVLGSAVPRYLEHSPAKGVSGLRAPEATIRILSEDEEDRLLGIASPENRALVLCALDTLQRLSAIGSLKREDDHGTFLEFLNTKTKGRHRVPVSLRLRLALDDLPKDGPWLFPTIHQDGDRPWKIRRTIANRFRELCIAAQVPHGRAIGGVTFHSHRHTGASRMLTGPGKADPKTVMEIGGWASMKVFEKYLHPTDAQRQAAVEAVGQRASDVRTVRPLGGAPGRSGTRPKRRIRRKTRPVRGRFPRRSR